MTPFELLNEIDVALADPETAAVPVQTVSLAAIPTNVICPLSDDPLMAPVSCPVQATDGTCQLAATFEPLCVAETLMATVGLLEDANVPTHAPETSTVLLPGEGAVEEPAHADVRSTARATRKGRMIRRASTQV